MQVAVEIRTKLAHDGPGAFNAGLAYSQHRLGSFLSKFDRYEEAVKATSIAVGLYPKLAHDSPNSFRDKQLAHARHDLGFYHSELKQFEEAAGAMRAEADI